MHFNDRPYERPDLDAAYKELKAHVERAKAASSTDARLSILKEYETYLSRLTTRLAHAQLRYYTNTLDQARIADMAYLGENAPRFDTLTNELTSCLLDAPERDALERALGTFFFDQAIALRETTTVQNEPLLVEEQALIQQYTALIARASVSYEGKTYSLSGMTRFYANPSRETRRLAMRAVNSWYEANASDLHLLFTRLVNNRTQQANRLGYANYTDMRYVTRYGYGRREIEAFRAHICKTWVPLVSKLKERQKKRLGVETFRLCDAPMRFPDGNPRLRVRRRAFLDAAQAMFQKLSPEAGAYFHDLDERGMLDLFARKGKIQYAGFCLWLPDDETAFLCAHFTGDQVDFEILAHEFGHAYAALRAKRAGVRFVHTDAPQEIMETHAKAMELFTMPHAGLFFGEADARRYQIKQLEYIPYLVTSVCIGDAFQHEIYDNPAMTPSQRNDAFERIWRTYNPYLDCSDLPFASWGSQWLCEPVFFSQPFYYIDYALAQILALALYRESLSDFERAWARSLKFMDAAGTQPFPTLVKACGLPSVFDKTTLDSLALFIEDELAKLES